jgi:hypothetical protein
MLFWGDADAGKSTFAASLMDKTEAQGDKPEQPPRWPRVAWINLDKPGVGSIARYFGEGSGARLIEPRDWTAIARVLMECEKWAARGEIDALVVEGLSVYYGDDVGRAALENPEAVAAGGNAVRSLYKAPKLRLQAMLAGVRGISKAAKSDDFVTVLTAHTKEVGEDHVQFPDMSRNAWKQLVRLCEVVIELKRPPGNRPPRLIYKRQEEDLLLARINNADALAYMDKIHAERNEARIAQMRTLPGLISLLEHGERRRQAAAATTSSNT